MDENKGYQEDSEKKKETKLPHLKESLKRENLIELGRKGITPFTQILHKYRDEAVPYIGALKKGCDAACKELTSQETEDTNASKTVCRWFEEASSMLENSSAKLSEDDPAIFFNYIKEQSRKHPLLMFSSSYLLGLIAGRLGKSKYVEQKTRSLH